MSAADDAEIRARLDRVDVLLDRSRTALMESQFDQQDEWEPVWTMAETITVHRSPARLYTICAATVMSVVAGYLAGGYVVLVPLVALAAIAVYARELHHQARQLASALAEHGSEPSSRRARTRVDISTVDDRIVRIVLCPEFLPNPGAATPSTSAESGPRST